MAALNSIHNRKDITRFLNLVPIIYRIQDYHPLNVEGSIIIYSGEVDFINSVSYKGGVNHEYGFLHHELSGQYLNVSKYLYENIYEFHGDSLRFFNSLYFHLRYEGVVEIGNSDMPYEYKEVK